MGYNIIKRLFWWRKKEETPPEEQADSEFPVSIFIGGTKEGDLDIKCEWQEENELTTALLAEILFYLDSGFLGPYVQNILIQHVSQNPETTDFMISVFTFLNNISQEASDKPLVRPSRVFGNEGEIGP
tara:strand:+ start:336 stop:719 length:384 start_codon:yes stop_codon:yes gene_type:complete